MSKRKQKAAENRARRQVNYLIHATGNGATPEAQAAGEMPDMLRISAEPAALEITAAGEAGADGKPKLRKFKMAAYNGGQLRLAYMRDPVYVDLDGMETPRQNIPIFLDHDSRQIVGHAEAVTKTSKKLTLAGIISGTGAEAAKVTSFADNGFPWQASIGAAITGTPERIEAGQTAQVNGRKINGPAIIVRQSVLAETSFVAIGADMTTDARIAATAATQSPDGEPSQPTPPPTTPPPNGVHATMNFNDWLRARGINPDTLDAGLRATLQASWAADTANGTKPGTPVQASGASGTNGNPAPPPAQPAPQQIQAAYDPAADRQAAAAEATRQREIRSLAATYPSGSEHMLEASGDNPAESVLERAIRAGWTRDQAELSMLRNNRANSVGIHAGHNQPAAAEVMEAALLQASGYRGEIERQFTDQALQAAHDRYRGRLGLQQLLIEAAASTGYQHRHAGRIGTSDLRPILKAAFASHDLSGILSNTANKFLLMAWNNVESTWRRVSIQSPVNDFKQVTRYRLTGAMEYEEVGPTGELKSADLGETSYSNQAKTFGRMTSITREDIINDDLGAYQDAPKRLGRGGALKLNKVFWTEFLADASTFYTTGRGNYFEGASSNLQSSSLKTAVEMFFKQTDEDGNPLGIMPAILLTAPEDSVTADELYQSTNNNTGGSATTAKVPNRNTFAGKYRPEVSSYLSNANINGYSLTAWWLLPDPADLAVIEVVFLDGKESPTIESADADFDTLGIQLRGYHDFGVAKQAYQAAVKSKGAS